MIFIITCIFSAAIGFAVAAGVYWWAAACFTFWLGFVLDKIFDEIRSLKK